MLQSKVPVHQNLKKRSVKRHLYKGEGKRLEVIFHFNLTVGWSITSTFGKLSMQGKRRQYETVEQLETAIKAQSWKVVVDGKTGQSGSTRWRVWVGTSKLSITTVVGTLEWKWRYKGFTLLFKVSNSELPFSPFYKCFERVFKDAQTEMKLAGGVCSRPFVVLVAVFFASVI